MEAEMFVIVHPPYFGHLNRFLDNLAYIPLGNKIRINVLSTQTEGINSEKIEDLVKNVKLDVHLERTNQKWTIGKARNEIAKRGNEKWAIFLDADIVLERNYLTNLRSFLEREGDNADAIAGGISFSKASKWGVYEGLMDLMIYLKNIKLSGPKEYLEIMSRLDLKDLVECQRVDAFNQSVIRELNPFESRQTSALQGFNQIIKRETFVQIGGFDEEMWSAEDREMGLRLTRNNKRLIFAPKVLALHNYNFSLADILKRKRIHGTWYGELRRKFPDDKRLEMSYARWGRNLLEAFNPTYPFGVNMRGRAYYLSSFITYASAAILSERLAINRMKNEKGGWIYGRDE